MKARIKSVLLILCIIFIPVSVTADSSSEGGNADGEFEKYFSNISGKLDLTDEKKQEVRPIFLSNFNNTKSIFRKYGFNPETGEKPGIIKLDKMKNEINQSEAETDKQLNAILSKQQMDELNQIRAQDEEKIKEELEDHKK